MNPYRKATLVCVTCRNVRRVHNIFRTGKEQCCDHDMLFVGSNVPARDDDAGWKELAQRANVRLRAKHPVFHGLATSFDYITQGRRAQRIRRLFGR